MKFSDQLRNAALNSGLSAYEICKRSKLDQGNFSKFLKGNARLSQDSIDKLAAVLGLRIVTDRPKAKSTAKAKAKGDK